MKRREFLSRTLTASTVPVLGCVAHGPVRAEQYNGALQHSCDTLVYGSTPGGIAAAVEAARRGDRVVLACPKQNPGGMTASGLCTTDAVRRHLFGGLVLEFISKVRDHYAQTLGRDHPEWKLVHDGWYYEPSVAERVFREMLLAEEEHLRWLPGHWLTNAQVRQGRIVRVQLEDASGEPLSVQAHTYIDATYEGDLAAKADVPYRVGREGRDEYGESLAGIHYMNWKSGKQIETADSGEPSLGIQAFCYRTMLTDDPEHRVPFTKPDTYEQHLPDYLPLVEDFAGGRLKSPRSVYNASGLVNRKFQSNGNIRELTSANCPGVSWAYPEADRRHREKLDRFHRDHVAGLMYFLQNDSHLPSHVREEARRLGLDDREFVDNDHWPWQLYVRQGRRIEGRAVVTQHNFIVDPNSGRTPEVENPIALGEHSFDVHPCHDRRFTVDGFMEGVLWYPKKAFGPAQPGQIPYGAMVPKTLSNLLAPVAMSSTHVAMSALRMEPVWMTTGQVAGLAAVTAREQNLDVADIDPAPLAKVLKIRTVPEA